MDHEGLKGNLFESKINMRREVFDALKLKSGADFIEFDICG